MPNTISSVWAMLSSTQSQKKYVYVGLYYVPCKGNGNTTKRTKTLQSIRTNIKYLWKTKGKMLKLF